MELSRKGKILEFGLALSFVVAGVSLRLLPHQPNFAPIAAIALFGGVYLPKKIALILPLAAMFISDLFIGFYEIKLMFFVYGSFLLLSGLGLWLRKRKKWQTVLGSSLAGAVMFYLLTNFAVWAFTPWYDKTLSGLLQSYFMAIPFFRNTLLGDLFYTTLFFGSYELLEIFVRQKFKINNSYAAKAVAS